MTRALSSQLGEQVHLAVTVDTSLDDAHHTEDTTGYADDAAAAHG